MQFFPELSAFPPDRRDTVCKAAFKRPSCGLHDKVQGLLELLELCLCVSAVPEPNTKQGTIQTDKIMDEKWVENLACILVAFLIAIALAALDRKAYPAQRAGKSSPAPTVTLKPVANIQRWGPSQWGVEWWLRDLGQPCHSQKGAQLLLSQLEPNAWISRWGFSPRRPQRTQG